MNASLDLPDVTLCAVDCVNPVLALRALEVSMSHCRFGDVVFLSDTASQYQLDGCRMVNIRRLGSRPDYSHFVIKELGAHLRGSHMLLVQWDGYVVNPGAWRPEFLDHDFIGAPWGFHGDKHCVGNGGFSLRSRRLFDALLDERITDTDPEDEAIGRRYRELLERSHDVRFADASLAGSFSFETTYFNELPFGFHGLFNMWMFLSREELPSFVACLSSQTVSGPQFLRLGQNYLELGRRDEALIVLERRLVVRADDVEARRLLDRCKPATQPASRNAACSCGSGKRYKHCCAQQNPTGATIPSPADPNVLLKVAMEHHQSGRLDDAQALYRRLLDLGSNPIATQYLGVLAMQRGDPVGGEAQIRAAIASNPNVADFHNNLGLCLRLQNRYEDAVSAYQQAVALDPSYVPGWNNLGLDLQALNRVDEATMQFRRAIALQPDFAEAHWNLGLSLLAMGNYADGWREYEWRLRCRPFTEDQLVLRDIRPWQGEKLEGKTLLVRGEQGAGDSFQFVRFLPQLTRQGARVLLDVSPELMELAITADADAIPIDRNAPAPKADFYVNLMSLPFHLGVTIDNLPGSTPYLHASDERVAEWKRRIELYPGPRIGLVWGGAPKHANDRNRSCPLAMLRPLLDLSEFTWFSLQKGPPADQLRDLHLDQIVDLGPQLTTYADTAAVLMALDLLIAVDTSVVHLAGALGQPAWVMLPFAPDWRWMLDRGDSPWYPSLRLYRQSALGDWGSIVSRLLDSITSARHRPTLAPVELTSLYGQP